VVDVGRGKGILATLVTVFLSGETRCLE